MEVLIAIVLFFGFLKSLEGVSATPTLQLCEYQFSLQNCSTSPSVTSPYCTCDACINFTSSSLLCACSEGLRKFYGSSTDCTGTASSLYYNDICYNYLNTSYGYSWCNGTLSLAPSPPTPTPATAITDICLIVYNGHYCNSSSINGSYAYCNCSECKQITSSNSLRCNCTANERYYYSAYTNCSGPYSTSVSNLCYNSPTGTSYVYSWCNFSGEGSYIQNPVPPPAPSPSPTTTTPASPPPTPSPPTTNTDICQFIFYNYSCNEAVSTITNFCNCSQCFKYGASSSIKCDCVQSKYYYYGSSTTCNTAQSSSVSYSWPNCHNGTGLSTWYNWCNVTGPIVTPSSSTSTPAPPAPTPVSPPPVPPPSSPTKTKKNG